MGSTQTGRLADALFSKTQQRVFALFFVNPDRTYFANEVVRLAGCGFGAAHRELAALEAAGLLIAKRVGNQKHYQANSAAPIFEELCGIARKTLGGATMPIAGAPPRRAPAAHAVHEERAWYAVLGVPAQKLRALCRKYRIRRLSLFGSAACGELKPSSDIDLMVEFDPKRPPTLWDMPEIEAAFSQLFNGRKVDLVPPSVLDNPHRRKTIAPDLKLLYAA